MQVFLRVSGWLVLILGIVFCLLGIASLPTGGLMFALAYFFFIPGFVFLVIGAALLFAAHLTKKSTAEKLKGE